MKGRFAAKVAKPGEEKQDASAEAPAVPPSPTQAPKAEATPETPPDAEQATPFSIRFSGQDYGIQGAVRTSTHLVIPNDQEETISRYIGMGLKFEAERDSIKRTKAETAYLREMFEAETGPVMEEVKRLFAIAGLADDDQFAQEFSKYAWELRNSLPMLKERMDLSKKRQELEIRERMSAPDPEVQTQQYAQTSIETAQQHFQNWQQDPAFKQLTKDDLAWIGARVQKDPLYFLHRVGQRPTPEEAESGVQPGEIYFAYDKLHDLAQIRLEYRKDLANAMTAKEQAVNLAKQNAVRQAAGSVPPPPTSGGADAAPASKEDGPKQYGSLAELRKDLGVGW